MGPDDFGLAPFGVRHAWRNPGPGPAPRPQSHLPQVMWLGGAPAAESVSWRPGDPGIQWLGRSREESLPPPAEGTMDGYSGGNLRAAPITMLVDHLFGAQHHNLFMVELAPNGIGTLHDHDFEESSFYLHGEMEDCHGVSETIH